jgi:hypothetical protein
MGFSPWFLLFVGVLTQALKPIILKALAARLKSCPDTKHEFFCNLESRALIQNLLFSFALLPEHSPKWA